MTDASRDATRESQVEFRRGPAWSIVFSGLAGVFASTLAILHQDGKGLDLGLLIVLFGCVVGGMLFRLRSIHWPDDPTARFRQVIYSLLAIALPPAVIYLGAGPGRQEGGFVMIAFVVACGIFASGTRRFRGTPNMDDQ